MMNLSNNGKKLIKKYEGCRLKAYKCPRGVWTIGYGHTNNVRPDDVITQDEAEELFLRDAEVFENAVNRLVKVALNQNQFDALVSFTFNLGYGIKGLGGSTLLRLLNNSDYIGAARQFERWVYSGDKVLEGLVKRRKEEKELFLKPV